LIFLCKLKLSLRFEIFEVVCIQSVQ